MIEALSSLIASSHVVDKVDSRSTAVWSLLVIDSMACIHASVVIGVRHTDIPQCAPPWHV